MSWAMRGAIVAGSMVIDTSSSANDSDAYRIGGSVERAYADTKPDKQPSLFWVQSNRRAQNVTQLMHFQVVTALIVAVALAMTADKDFIFTRLKPLIKLSDESTEAHSRSSCYNTCR